MFVFPQRRSYPVWLLPKYHPVTVNYTDGISRFPMYDIYEREYVDKSGKETDCCHCDCKSNQMQLGDAVTNTCKESLEENDFSSDEDSDISQNSDDTSDVEIDNNNNNSKQSLSNEESNQMQLDDAVTNTCKESLEENDFSSDDISQNSNDTSDAEINNNNNNNSKQGLSDEEAILKIGSWYKRKRQFKIMKQILKSYKKLATITQDYEALYNTYDDKVFHNPVLDKRGRVNYDILAYTDAMEKLMIKIDSVSTGGNEQVRIARKKLVRELEKKLEKVDAYRNGLKRAIDEVSHNTMP
jgi:hypothetical protein